MQSYQEMSKEELYKVKEGLEKEYAKYILVSSAVVCDKLHLRTGVHYRHILLFI